MNNQEINIHPTKIIPQKNHKTYKKYSEKHLNFKQSSILYKNILINLNINFEFNSIIFYIINELNSKKYIYKQVNLIIIKTIHIITKWIKFNYNEMDKFINNSKMRFY